MGRHIKAVTELHKMLPTRSYKKHTRFNICYVYARQLFCENYARAIHRDNLVARVAVLREKKFDRAHASSTHVKLTLCRRSALCPSAVAQQIGDLRPLRESILFRRGSRPYNQMIRFTY